VAGFALGRSYLPLALSRGVVASLAVRPAWRCRSLGLALLRNALGEFHRHGCASVELLVDGDSLTGALRLYERAGRRAFRTQVVYEKGLCRAWTLRARTLRGEMPVENPLGELRGREVEEHDAGDERDERGRQRLESEHPAQRGHGEYERHGDDGECP